MHFPILTSLDRAAAGRRRPAALRARRRGAERAGRAQDCADRLAAGVCRDAAAVEPLQPGLRRVPVRRAPRVDSGVRHRLFHRRRRHQPAAARADRLPDADRAAQLVGVGAQEHESVQHLRAAARERDDGRLRLARSLPLLRVLGRDAGADVLPDRHLGLRAAHLRRHQVHPLHDGGQRPDAAGDPRPRLPARHGRGHLQLRSVEAVRAAGRTGCCTCSSGSSSRSRWRSPSRCRCFRSIPGCPTRTSRRRPPGR